MRTIPMVAALTIASTLAGCGTVKVLDGVEVRCKDKEVHVINRAGRLQVRPELVEVCRGNSVALTFDTPVPARRARTMPARGAATDMWLSVENAATDRLTIVVPDTIMPMEYKYSLAIDGLGTLDPRIVVE